MLVLWQETVLISERECYLQLALLVTCRPKCVFSDV